MQESFKKFLCGFYETALDEDEMVVDENDVIDRTQPYYLQRLQEVNYFLITGQLGRSLASFFNFFRLQ